MRRVLVPPELPKVLHVHGPPSGPLQTYGGQTMGTSWTVKLAAPVTLPVEIVQEDMQDRLEQVDAQMSNWREQSALSQFNSAAASTWHPLPPELFTVLDCALAIARSTDGAYDPTGGALTRLWGFGPTGSRTAPPTPAQVDAARTRSGWRRLSLDREAGMAQQAGGIELDLCAIAKGYAVDLLGEYLTDLGVDHYLVEVGGELLGRGCKPDGSPWWVALEPPAAHTQGIGQTVIGLHEVAAATSGDYRRYFEHEGRRYSHALDPRGGYPIDNGLAAVTVLHSACMQADALATALLVMGVQAGAEYARNNDVAALFTARTADGFTEYLSPALAAWLAADC